MTELDRSRFEPLRDRDIRGHAAALFAFFDAPEDAQQRVRTFLTERVRPAA